jgi:hypothetical protein
MLKRFHMLIIKQISAHRSTIFFLFLTMLLGLYVRLTNVLPLSYPINDGGLFYAMTADLKANHYILPDTTSYNAAGIPFAYPPLAFYLAGFLSDIFHWNLLDIFRILPAIISMAVLPGLYLLANDLLKSKAQASIACLIFALTPGAFLWLIMGGGLTRGLGLAFALMTLHYAYLLYDKEENRYIFPTAFFAAGTVLSHPEMAVHTVASALVMFLFWGHNKKGWGLSALTAGLTFLLTAVWWFPLLQNHGFSPVLAAGQTGWHSLDAIPTLLLFNFAQETSLTIVGCMALVGVFISLAQKNYFLMSWLVFIYISEPRSAPLYMLPLISMFAALCLHQLVFPGIQPGRPRPAENASWADALLASGIAKLAFAFLLAYLLLGAMNTAWEESHDMVLRDNDVRAIQWVQASTPKNSRFILVTGEQPMTDTLSEWFPAMTGRTSLATVQGYEWMPAGRLLTKMSEYGFVQSCLNHDESCLFDWAQKTKQPFEYIIVRPNTESQMAPALKTALDRSNAVRKVFELPGVSIFSVAKP